MTHEDPDRIAAAQVDQVDQVGKLRRVVGSQAYLRRHPRGVKEHISGVNVRAAIAGSVAPRNRDHDRVDVNAMNSKQDVARFTRVGSRILVLVPFVVLSSTTMNALSNLRKDIRSTARIL
jgi:hypothetical protein